MIKKNYQVKKDMKFRSMQYSFGKEGLRKGKMLLIVKETLDAKRNCIKMELNANVRGSKCYRL